MSNLVPKPVAQGKLLVINAMFEMGEVWKLWICGESVEQGVERFHTYG